jgi:hypothetical protein
VVARQLRYLAQSAVQPEAARSTVTYAVSRRDGAYEISRDGALEDVQFDPVGVLGSVYRRVHGDALAAWPRAAALRAITGSWGGERFVVVGDGLRERSQLALHLISRGAEIEADDLAILHDGVLTAYPRPLHVYGTDARLPAGSPPRTELPSGGENSSRGPWVLDLTAAGLGWRVTTAPVDRVVLLETNYGGQTRLHPVARHEAARIVMSCCDVRADVPEAIRSIARLVDGAQCCRLLLGGLEQIGNFWPAAWRDTLPVGTTKGMAHGRGNTA